MHVIENYKTCDIIIESNSILDKMQCDQLEQLGKSFKIYKKLNCDVGDIMGVTDNEVKTF